MGVGWGAGFQGLIAPSPWVLCFFLGCLPYLNLAPHW